MFVILYDFFQPFHEVGENFLSSGGHSFSMYVRKAKGGEGKSKIVRHANKGGERLTHLSTHWKMPLLARIV